MADPINSSDKEITEIIEKIKKIELGQISKLVEIAKKEFNIKEEVVVQPATAASSAVSEKNKEKETSNVSVKWVKREEGKGGLREILGIIRDAVKESTGKEIKEIDALKLTKSESGIILENTTREKAKEVKEKLEAKGVEVEVK